MDDQHTQKEHPLSPRRLLLRWLISTLAIFTAVWLVPGIHFEGPGWQLGVVAFLFGLLNALLRPFMIVLTIVTLGLFGLVINAILLMLSSGFADHLGIQFYVEGFWSAFLGGLIISLVSMVLTILAGDQRVVVKVQRGGMRDD